jgi:hypothetical protein
MNDNPFKTYSCRFEFTHDFTAFIIAADKQGVQINTSELHHRKHEGDKYPAPDVYVEFKAEVSLETLQAVLRQGTDLHVGLQTLRPVSLEDNSLERDYSLI